MGGIRVKNQAVFDPKIFMEYIARQINGGGSHIFEQTRVIEIQENTPCQLITDSGAVVFARDVVVATDAVSANRFFLQTKVAAYRTYAVAAQIKTSRLGTALFWDGENPYHYIRPAGNRWIIGGADHKTGMESDTESCFGKIEQFVSEQFKVESFDYSWSEQILESVDGLPFIGLNPTSRHIYVSLGYSGNGITFGTLGGNIIADLAAGKENQWSDLYEPKRIKLLAAAKDFLAENKDFARCLISDRFSKSEVKNIDEVPLGQGKRIAIEGKAAAVYKDPHG